MVLTLPGSSLPPSCVLRSSSRPAKSIYTPVMCGTLSTWSCSHSTVVALLLPHVSPISHPTPSCLTPLPAPVTHSPGRYHSCSSTPANPYPLDGRSNATPSPLIRTCHPSLPVSSLAVLLLPSPLSPNLTSSLSHLSSFPSLPSHSPFAVSSPRTLPSPLCCYKPCIPITTPYYGHSSPATPLYSSSYSLTIFPSVLMEGSRVFSGPHSLSSHPTTLLTLLPPTSVVLPA